MLLLIFLQWPVLLWGSYHRYLWTHIGVMVLDSFLVIAGCFYFMAMTEALPWKAWRQRLFASSLLVSAILSTLEIFAIWQYGTLFGEGLMTVILETNPAEAVEYLRSVRHSVLTLLGLLLILSMTACRLHKLWQKRHRRLSRKVLVLIQPEVIGIFLAVLYIRPIGGEAPFDLPITQIGSASVRTW
ncbi:MAG: DUF1705 domain-containing protein, partial [Selenomonadaceae bacterium]|nr:DUF1705 domain-containing protein [Selenomonadaceae bacterium]